MNFTFFVLFYFSVNPPASAERGNGPGDAFVWYDNEIASIITVS